MIGKFHKHGLFVLLLQIFSARAYDFPKFYRAAYFFGEPRLVKPGLTSIDVSFAAGSTKKSRNCNGDTTKLFDLNGTSNMQLLAAGIPGLNPSDPADLALIYLSRVPGRGGFAHMSLGGQFTLVESILSFTQNIFHGFFVQCFVPLKYMSVSDFCCKDLSPTDNSYPNIKNPYWQMFLNQFNTILDKYDLSLDNWKETGVGDISFLAGFGCNYQETEVLDYIDMCFKIGLSVPSGREKSTCRILDIPAGYDGHFAIPILFDCSLGLFDWFTAGIHGDVLPFFAKTKEVRIKTDCNQCGPINLATGCALINKGPLFDIGAYLKADHFARGLSLLIGYSYSKKYKDSLTPLDTCIFDTCVANSDSALRGWEMHTIHLLAEFDLTKEECIAGPRLAAFYNAQIYGRSVFKNNMGGMNFGIDIAWKY